MPQDDESTSGPEPPSKLSRTQEARRIVEEYADDLRAILKKLRKLFQLTSSNLFQFEPRKKGALWHVCEVAVDTKDVRLSGRPEVTSPLPKRRF